jgi:hypothetical protein
LRFNLKPFLTSHNRACLSDFLTFGEFQRIPL